MPKIDLRREGQALLCVRAEGVGTLADVIATWQAIVADIARHRPQLVLLVDEFTGPPLDANAWRWLVDAMRGRGLEGLRIAHVKPHGLGEVEHCEIFAGDAGLVVRVFVREREARTWLFYGARED